MALIPLNYNFSIWLGASFEIQFLRQDDAGATIEFPDYTPRFTAKKKVTDVDPVLVIEDENQLYFDDDWNLILKLNADDLPDDLVENSPCCLVYAISLIKDADPEEDILAYADGRMEIIIRADTLQPPAP